MFCIRGKFEDRKGFMCQPCDSSRHRSSPIAIAIFLRYLPTPPCPSTHMHTWTSLLQTLTLLALTFHTSNTGNVRNPSFHSLVWNPNPPTTFLINSTSFTRCYSFDPDLREAVDFSVPCEEALLGRSSYTGCLFSLLSSAWGNNDCHQCSQQRHRLASN